MKNKFKTVAGGGAIVAVGFALGTFAAARFIYGDSEFVCRITPVSDTWTSGRVEATIFLRSKHRLFKEDFVQSARFNHLDEDIVNQELAVTNYNMAGILSNAPFGVMEVDLRAGVCTGIVPDIESEDGAATRSFWAPIVSPAVSPEGAR